MLLAFPLGLPELVIILVVVLLIFGANKLPQLGDALGKSIRNFKKATTESNEIDVTPRREQLTDAQRSEKTATTKAHQKA